MYNYFWEYKVGSKEYKKIMNEVIQKIWKFFFDDAKRMGFEEREGQQDMALDIADAIKDNQHIVVEAGVGIGKSFAYIVPVVLYQSRINRPVVIATSTIALQEQLVSDLHTIFDILKIHPDVILAKGQNHFLCKKRASSYFNSEKRIKTDNEKSFLVEIKNNVCDRKDFKIKINDDLWNKVNINKFNYSVCNKCEYGIDCYYYRLREKMKTTNGIIVCNQDLLTVNLQKHYYDQKTIFNPDLSLIIVDEAHNLEDKVRSSLTKSYTKKAIIKTVGDVIDHVHSYEYKVDKRFKNLKKHLNILFSIFDKQIDKQISDSNLDMKYAERFFISFSDQIIKEINTISNVIHDLYIDMDIYFSMQDNYYFNISTDEVDDIDRFFSSLLNERDSNLYWLERNSNYIKLATCPKNISYHTKKLYFNR